MLSYEKKNIIKKNYKKIWKDYTKTHMLKLWYIGRLYLFIKNSKNNLDESLLCQWDESMNKS